MPRRLREKTQEEEESEQKEEEIRTPHNEAGSETAKASDVDLLGGNNINPLLKIVFIQRVLLFAHQNGIVFDKILKKYNNESSFLNYQQTTNLASIPKLFQLKNVTNSWNETVEYYFFSIPSDIVIRFCSYLKDLVRKKYRKSKQHAALARDALLWISKFIGHDASVREWCDCVYWIIKDNARKNREIFGTEQVRDAIVAVSKYCTSLQSAVSFCRSILNVTLFSGDNEDKEILFGTAAVRDAIIGVSKYCTTSDSAASFFRSIIDLTTHEDNKILFGTTSVRDALLVVSEYCTTSDSVYALCCSISKLASNIEANKVLFGTASVRDAIINVSKYCASDSANNLCFAIEHIIDHNESNKVLFATEAIRDAILSVSAYIGSGWGVYSCCHVIYLLHETNPTLFCVEKTVTSLVNFSKIERYLQSPEYIYWFINVVLALFRSNKRLFDTNEIRNAVDKFQEVVNEPEQVGVMKYGDIHSLDKMSNEEYVDKARQLCIEFQKVVSEKSEASSCVVC